jgi:leader peptidase (prepilin peptidase)/N-methyltransferase
MSKAFFHRPGIGAGDIKLAAMLGLFLGWQQVVVVIWLACVAGAVYGIAGISAGRFTRTSKIPLGFFLGLCAIAYIIAKTKIIHYLVRSWPCL